MDNVERLIKEYGYGTEEQIEAILGKCDHKIDDILIEIIRLQHEVLTEIRNFTKKFYEHSSEQSTMEEIEDICDAILVKVNRIADKVIKEPQ